VLDWGEAGLRDTLATLARHGIHVAGAGLDGASAMAPAAIALPGGGRLLVFGFGSPTSGVSRRWAATRGTPGVNLLRDLSDSSLAAVAQTVGSARRPGDIAVISIHWGGNWGYEVSGGERRFARALVDRGVCDILHGHSSHHPRPLEVYRGKLILYGSGDFLNDYEGISGYEQYRSDLVLMYLPRLAVEGSLLELKLVPFRTRRFRLERAAADERRWISDTLDRESRRFDTRVMEADDGSLQVRWR
jgi:poly-gamma-glutamate synthesis protein (capsule biosynthesis protein)